MKEFKGKVAVVTGAASGIGRALAAKSAQEGMKVVLADVEEPALKQAEGELKASGAQVLAVRTDVSQATEVETLARQAFETYGAVHLLFNNAGVLNTSSLFAGTTVWESALADWQWVLGVNLWGVIHGLHAFVPRMLAQESEGHIVNTASSTGLISGAGLGVYKASKHGIVTLSETLALELAAHGARLKASVLCPDWVNTRIINAERNRPQALQHTSEQLLPSPQVVAMLQAMRQGRQAGLEPSEVADLVFDAIRQEQFYILPDPQLTKQFVQLRMEDILQERLPTDGVAALLQFSQQAA